MSGAPTATTVFLSLDAIINYSDGTSDTLPANTLAVLPDTTTVFDRTHDVYVCYTVQASHVLSVIKESLLPTLTSAYAPLCRIEMHGIKPYQPEPYLAGGGLGSPAPSTTTVVSTPGRERLFNLGNSSGYASEPSGWQDVGFDDSAWTASIDATSVEGGYTPVTGATWVSYSLATLPGSQIFLLRRTLSLPAGLPQSATLLVSADADIMEAWLDGVAIPGTPALNLWPSAVSLEAPRTAVLPGGAAVLALKVRNGTATLPDQGPMGVEFKLTVVYGSGLPDPGGHEGDLLYYTGGAWTDLPIGTTGKVLTSDGTDPGWAVPATSGTVTSVALAGPTGTTVSGSPVTTSGTLTLSWSSQSASTFLGAPSGSSGVPTFRALVGADIPVDASTIISAAGTIKGNYQAGSGISISGNTISASGGGGSGTVTSVALTMPGLFTVSGSPISTSGTLAVTLANESAASVFAGPASGSAAAPTFRALQGSDLPAAAAAGGHIHAHGHFL